MLAWNPLSTVSTRRPALVVALAVALVGAAGLGLSRLELRMDGRSLVPRGAPEVEFDARVRDTFGLTDPIVLRLRSQHPAGIYEPGTLRRLAELSAALTGCPELAGARITSLATETGDRFVPGTMDLRRFLEPFPQSPAAFEELRDDVRALGIYRGTLVAFDERSTVILIGLPASADRRRVHAALENELAARDLHDDVDILGAPIAESHLGNHILADLGIPGSQREGGVRGLGIGLLPLVLLFVGGVFGIAFRSPVATVLPLVQMGASVVFVFGCMGWAGVPVYLTMAVLPVILCVMGITDDIHFFNHLRHRRSGWPAEDPAEAVRATLGSLARPMVTTSLTTAAGFLSFAFSPLPPVAAFGIWAAVGIVFSMLWSLFVVPALLVRWRLRAGSVGGGAAWGRFAAAMVLRRRPVVILALLLLAAVPAGIARLRVQDGWIEGFSARSDFRRATADFESQFFGTHVLQLVVQAPRRQLAGEVAARDVHDWWIDLPHADVPDTAALAGGWVTLRRSAGRVPSDETPVDFESWTGWVRHASHAADTLVLATAMTFGSPLFALQPGAGDTLHYQVDVQPWMTPAMLTWSAELAEFLRRQNGLGVGGVLGPVDFLTTTQFIVRHRAADARQVPDDPGRIRWLWSQYARVRGEARLREILDADFGTGVLSVYLRNANFESSARLMRAVRAWHAAHPGPTSTRIDFAGDVAVSQTLIEAIVSTQVRSLALSLAVVLLVTSSFMRSLRWGLFCIVPCVFAVAGCFAVMGFAGMPLGVATSMFAAMVVGIGVDYAIHVVSRYRLAQAAGVPPGAAVSTAFTATGPALGIDALAVGAGFGLLAVSSVPANARLGIVVLACIAVAFATTCFLLPVLLAGRERGVSARSRPEST